MIKQVQQLVESLAREYGKRPQILKIVINEDMYKRLITDMKPGLLVVGIAKYGDPVILYTWNGKIQIEVDMIDRDLRDIHTGRKEICL